MTAKQKVALSTLETVGYVTQVVLKESGELEVSWNGYSLMAPDNFPIDSLRIIINKNGEIKDMTNGVSEIVINLGNGSKTKINMYDTIDDGYVIEVSYKKKGGRWKYAFGIPGTPENIKNAELIAINNAAIYLKGDNKNEPGKKDKH